MKFYLLVSKLSLTVKDRDIFMQEIYMKQLTELHSWKCLAKHAEALRLTTIKELKNRHIGMIFCSFPA
ncbi:hypothetical protein [Legionella tunisiensis]|uniref:hypothetical protein n=1 Tax=Legionella tunisiensis TaxID=1034944 RepID=UPI0004745D18|nr:hypothetical protein [Legionella tunisiensis]